MLAREHPRSVQGHYGLARARAAANACRSGEGGVGDRPLRRVQVDHPLLYGAVQQPAQLAAGRRRNKLGLAGSGVDPLAQLGLFDLQRVDGGHTALVEHREVMLRPLPDVGHEEREIDVLNLIGEHRPDIDRRR